MGQHAWATAMRSQEVLAGPSSLGPHA